MRNVRHAGRRAARVQGQHQMAGRDPSGGVAIGPDDHRRADPGERRGQRPEARRTFAVEIEAEGGRRRRKYPQELVMTPYEKLRSLPGADGFLKPGITFEQLDAVAQAATDLEAAQEVQRARKALFRLVAKALNPAA